MASKREIKKDLNFLTNEVLIDGIMLMSLYGEKENEAILKELENVAEKRNLFVQTIQNRANKHIRLPKEERKKGRRERAKDFKKVLNESFVLFEEALDTAYENFGKLVKAD